MPIENRIKVCLVAISLARGGAERSTALLSQMLDSKGYEVHLVVLNDEIDYPYSGELFNLGELKTQNDSVYKRIIRFKKLRTYLRYENFDYIIDNRNRQSSLKELYYIRYLYKGFKTIYVIRSANLEEYLPRSKFVTNQLVQKAFAIIGVSKYISKEINATYNTDKAVNIYNPAPNFKESEEEIKGRYILFIGRLEDSVKNISLLLDAYSLSVLPSKNVRLKILGDGSDKNALLRKAENLSVLDKVEFIPFTPDVYPYLKNALFSVLTSRYEGFPRSLIESLSVGTPVISVDCVSGPNEIIVNEKNGLLVPNHDAKALADAMNRFILEEDLYRRCKNYAKESIAHLSFEKIAEGWDNILKIREYEN